MTVGLFDAMDIAASGIGLGRRWLDVVAHNLANVSTIRGGEEEPFRAKLLVVEERRTSDGGRGVTVAGTVEAGGDPARVFDPEHPLADDEGYVTMPVVDMAGQMNDLLIASRTYQANLRVLEASREAYQAAVRLGRS